MFKNLKYVIVSLATLMLFGGAFALPKWTTFWKVQEPIALPVTQIISGGIQDGKYVSGGNVIIDLGDNASGYVQVDDLYNFSGDQYITAGEISSENISNTNLVLTGDRNLHNSGYTFTMTGSADINIGRITGPSKQGISLQSLFTFFGWSNDSGHLNGVMTTSAGALLRAFNGVSSSFVSVFPTTVNVTSSDVINLQSNDINLIAPADGAVLTNHPTLADPLSIATVKTVLDNAGSTDNIYTANGTQTGDRTMQGADFNLNLYGHDNVNINPSGGPDSAFHIDKVNASLRGTTLLLRNDTDYLTLDTDTTFTDNGGDKDGIQYSSDYCATLDPLSLMHKSCVESTIATEINTASGNYVHLVGDEAIYGIKTFQNDVVINGDLYTNGTATYLNSTVLNVEDKNIFLGMLSGGGATDITADGGGVKLSGDTMKEFVRENLGDQWSSTESINIDAGNYYRINDQNVFQNSVGSSTELGASQFAIQQYVGGELATGGNLITKVGNNMNLGGTSTAQVTMNMGADALEIVHTDSNAEFLEDEIILFAAGAELNLGGSASLSSTVGGETASINLYPPFPSLYNSTTNTSGFYLNYPNGFDPEPRSLLRNMDIETMITGYIEAYTGVRFDQTVATQIAQDGRIEADFGAVFLEDDGGIFKLEVAAGGLEFELVDEGGQSRFFLRSDDGVNSGHIGFGGQVFVGGNISSHENSAFSVRDDGTFVNIFQARDSTGDGVLVAKGSLDGGTMRVGLGDYEDGYAAPFMIADQATDAVEMRSSNINTNLTNTTIIATDGAESSQLYLSPGYADLTTNITGMVRLGDNHFDFGNNSYGAHFDVKQNAGSSSYIEGILVGASRGKLHLDNSLWYIGDGINGIGNSGLRSYMTEGSQSIEVSNTATNISGLDVSMIASNNVLVNGSDIVIGEQDGLGIGTFVEVDTVGGDVTIGGNNNTTVLQVGSLLQLLGAADTARIQTTPSGTVPASIVNVDYYDNNQSYLANTNMIQTDFMRTYDTAGGNLLIQGTGGFIIQKVFSGVDKGQMLVAVDGTQNFTNTATTQSRLTTTSVLGTLLEYVVNGVTSNIRAFDGIIQIEDKDDAHVKILKGVITYSGTANSTTYTEMLISDAGGGRIQMPANSTMIVEATVVGYSSVNSKGSSQIQMATFRRDGAGNTIRISTDLQDFQRREDNLWDVTLTADDATEEIVLEVKATNGSQTLVNAEVSYTIVTN